MFPNNQKHAWMATRGGQGGGKPPRNKSCQHSGYYILRNGWDEVPLC